MKVFVVGGSGLVGSAVVTDLLTHDHTVLALARSEASAQALTALGADVLPGSLDDLDALRTGVERCEGVINVAFNHDFSSDESVRAAVEQERRALDAIVAGLVGTGRPLVIASGTPFVPGRSALESDPTPVIEGPLAGRGQAVEAVLALSAQGVRSSAVRLPRTVHADGLGGFAGILTELARQRGVAGYPGDGSQRWPAVHARDAATVFRLALESAPGGTSWHAVAEEGVAVRDIVDAIGRALELPVEPLPADALGPLAGVFATDCPASGAHTRAALGWEPRHLGLLADLAILRPATDRSPIH